MLPESAFADRWSVGVFETVGGVTGVHMAPLVSGPVRWDNGVNR
jgi:hypothetical protein